MISARIRVISASRVNERRALGYIYTYPTKHGETRPHDCRHMGCQSDVRVDVHTKITHIFYCWNRRVANGHQSWGAVAELVERATSDP